jgi:hypothetical protein
MAFMLGLLALTAGLAHAQFELTEVSSAGATPFLLSDDEWTYEDVPAVSYGFYRLRPGELGFTCIHGDQVGPSWTGDPESPADEGWWYLVTAHDGSVENQPGIGSRAIARVLLDSCWEAPTGACCVDLDCSEQTMSDCLDLGGAYLGDGVPCEPASCSVDLCHFDGLGGGELIQVPAGDVAAHLAHGDDVPRFGGYCYILVDSPALAADGEQACVLDFGGHLASIHGAAEDDHVSAIVDPAGLGGITAHVGGVAPAGFCDGVAGVYGWSDGTPWDYSNWRAPGEPNCSSMPFGAIQFWPNTNGGNSGWNDVRGDRFTARYVCKFGGL